MDGVTGPYDHVLATFPQLAGRLNHGGWQLSGREQQMLTIGRALMTNPYLLILDEATDGPAPLIAREIWRIISDIRASGIATVIVDKNYHAVAAIADRTVVLVKGRVVFGGAAQAWSATTKSCRSIWGLEKLGRTQAMTINDTAHRAAGPVHHPPHFVEAGGHRLEYVDIPAHHAQRPPLLFLHEGLGSVALWRDFPAQVAAATGCRTVVYSRYGFGRSSPRREPYTPSFMHDEAFIILPEMRAKLAIEHPVLIGHSTGASMALIHASMDKSDVAGLVLMAPLTFVEEFNLDSIRRAKDVYRTTDLREKLARYHDDVDDVFWGWNNIWLNPDFKSWRIEDDLPGIRCPMMAILGDDDEYSTPAQIEMIQRKAVHAASFDFLKLADCRHSPHRDQPAIVIEAITRFIDGPASSAEP